MANDATSGNRTAPGPKHLSPGATALKMDRDEVLAEVLRNHPTLTRAEALAMLTEAGL